MFKKSEAGRNSPPSLLMFGNNYLKQLAFGARANSPAPICRSSNYHSSGCSRCAHRIMLFLKVVMVVSKSQYEWVKNGDAPVSLHVSFGEAALSPLGRMAGGSAGRLAPPLLLLLVLCAIRQLSLHAELLHHRAELALAVVEVSLRILRAPARRGLVNWRAARLVVLETRQAAAFQLLVHEAPLLAG